ncbi:porin [Pseudoroseicyclus tamaricis]|uniref:Porin n=1 Tax=Pseudoroseicyclus tamaricis TaxID=2705421 RepID=A0A6B2K0T5_9RHOB|nr:porin [Pseudoroseicyclus tamaricis]NDV02559.1 porin [Pseudoroseicyclus tamaricis]
MKSILLASASLFAFAGAAAAEVSFTAEATVGYNDTNVDDTIVDDDPFGFYWNADLDLFAENALDNGLTVGFTIGGDLVDDDLGTDFMLDGYELFVSTDMAAVFVGDTALAADEYFSSADGMDVGFDGDPTEDSDAVIRGEFTFGLFSTYTSYSIFADGGLEGVQTVLAGTFGNFDIIGAYQDDQGDSGTEVFGVSVGTTFGAADVTLGYTSDQTNDADSIGIEASYPFGPVVVGGYYAANDPAADAYGVSVDYTNGPIMVSAYYDTDEDENDDYGIEGSYDFGSGIEFYAGAIDLASDDIDYYVGATWDMDGVILQVSYAEDPDSSAEDEIGDPEFQEGLTVEASFEF